MASWTKVRTYSGLAPARRSALPDRTDDREGVTVATDELDLWSGLLLPVLFHLDPLLPPGSVPGFALSIRRA